MLTNFFLSLISSETYAISAYPYLGQSLYFLLHIFSVYFLLNLNCIRLEVICMRSSIVGKFAWLTTFFHSPCVTCWKFRVVTSMKFWTKSDSFKLGHWYSRKFKTWEIYYGNDSVLLFSSIACYPSQNTFGKVSIHEGVNQ